MKATMNTLTSGLLAALAFSQPCDAFFRNLMIGDTGMARIDPIVNPGEPASHVHHLNGAGNLDFNSDGQTLSQSQCTNSILTQDKSAYWAPWLYFQHDNGTFENVDLALGLTAYYKYEKRGNAPKDAKYSVFPKGLRMLTGDTARRSWEGPWPVPAESNWGKDDKTQKALQAKAMGFNCMNYEPGKNEATFAFPYLRQKSFLDSNCINGVRAEIIFPSCWDGENLDTDNHKDHMAFPSLIQDGVCPDTHPVYLPILFYETIWQTNAFANVPGQFVFSNGDPTGFGYHADFIAAWDDGVQESVQNDPTCTGLGTDGQVESCATFQGHIQSQSDARQCKVKLPSDIINEAVDGPLDSLPGNVKISGTRHDPGENVGADPYEPSTSVPKHRPTSKITMGSQAATTDYYKPPATPATTAAQSTSVWTDWHKNGSGPDVPSVTMAAQIAETSAPSSYTSTYTSGTYVVELIVVQMTTTVTADGPSPTAPAGAEATESVKARMKRHALRHAHSHGHF